MIDPTFEPARGAAQATVRSVSGFATTATGAPSSEPHQAGALLTEDQIGWVRLAVIVMTTLLIVGVVVLVGRIIYLARSGGRQATSAATGVPVQPILRPEIRLALPAGAEIKAITATGDRLAILHAAPSGGETISIVDLASGEVVSRVTVSRGQ